MSPSQTPERLFTKEFVLLSGILFLAAVTRAVFFQFHQYLLWLEITPDWAGFIMSADSLAALVIQPVISTFIVAGNSRKWLFLGIVASMGALLLYNIADTVPSMTAVRMFHGAGYICLISAIIVMVTQDMPPEKSGQGFGIITTMSLLPYAVIPPLMQYIHRGPRAFIVALNYAAILMAFSIISVYLLRPGTKEVVGKEGQGRITFAELTDNLKDKGVVAILVVNLLLFCGYSAVFFFIEGYNRTTGIENPGLFFTIATFIMIGLRLFAGGFFDRIDKKLFIALSMVLLAVSYTMLTGIPRHILFFHGAAILAGFGWGAGSPLLSAFVFDISRPRFRGLNVNLSLVMMQGGFFIGPLLGGIFHGLWGYGAVFIFCAAAALSAAVLTYATGKK